MSGGGVVDRAPVPAPVEQHRTLRAGLEVVLLAKDDLDGRRAAAAAGARDQQRVPTPRSRPRRRAASPATVGRPSDLAEESERGESGRQHGRQAGDKRRADVRKGIPVAAEPALGQRGGRMSSRSACDERLGVVLHYLTRGSLSSVARTLPPVDELRERRRSSLASPSRTRIMPHGTRTARRRLMRRITLTFALTLWAGHADASVLFTPDIFHLPVQGNIQRYGD